MAPLYFDIAHLLAGGLVLVSFMLLYQDRMFGLLNVFALHACVLALSVAWQAFIQDAPHLYVGAGIDLQHLGVARELLHLVLGHVAVAAEQLHGFERDLGLGLR